MKSINLIYLIAILLLFLSCSYKDKKANRPNIIVILSDDMGYSDVSSYGSEIQTPRLDKLAENGVRFSQFYNTSRCVPTRASLLTGLYPAQTGAGFMTGDEHLPGYRGEISKNTVTLAEVVKKSGYKTYMSGKWHITRNLDHTKDSLKYNWPIQRGFDKFYGTIIGAGSLWDPWTLSRGNTYITPENDPEYQSEEKWYYTDAISDNAVKYIREHVQETKDEQSPFFMYVSYTAPHWPLHAPEEEIALHKGKYDVGFQAIREARYDRLKEIGLIDENWELSDQTAKWDTLQNKEWHARNMEVYAAMITRMDKGIGKIIDELTEKELLDNTLILYLQDNGGNAEVLSFFQIENEYETPPKLPPFEPMGPNELQTQMLPKQTREGYPVIAMGKKIMAGNDQTYHAYGPAWANVSNTPFRLYKHYIQEGGIATPLIAHWPKAIKDHGAIRHQPGHVIDIMPTVVDVSGATYPDEHEGNEIIPMEGVSLRDVLINNESIDRETIYFEHEGNRGLRKGKWKLVSKGYDNAGYFRRTDTIPMDQWALYDLEKNRTETNDLAAENQDLVKELTDLWYKWAKRTNTIPKPK